MIIQKWNKLLCSLLALTLALTSISVAAGEPVVEYIHTDAFGTPIAVTDANGNVIERFEYEPYGLQVSGPVEDGPGYTGHVEDAATGLTYMQQRYYDPGIGMFLSVDPVTAHSNPVAQFNRYRYANGNPYRFLDPTGMCSAEHSQSEWACYLEDKIREQIEPIIADYMESAGVEVVPEDERDPEGEYDYEAEEGQPVVTEVAVIVVGGIKARAGRGGIRSKPGSLGKFKSRDGLRRENKQARDAAKAAGLNDDEMEKLHDQIEGQGLGYHQILEIARDIKRNGG